jgi:hypothetical protein
MRSASGCKEKGLKGERIKGGARYGFQERGAIGTIKSI